MKEIETKESVQSEYIWNIVITIVFVVLFACYMRVYGEAGANMILNIPPYHFILLALAAFRLTRLLVSDHITQWLRDLFVIVTETTDAAGVTCVERTKPKTGIRRVIAELFGCPWCVGVWSAFIVLGLYVAYISGTFVAGGFIIAILAVAAVASIIQTCLPKPVAPTAPVATEVKPKPAVHANVCTDCGFV